MYDLKGKRVFVAGHRGLVGSAITRRLAGEDCEIVTATRDEVDLADQSAVRKWMAANQPDTIVLAAAKVGGILATARSEERRVGKECVCTGRYRGAPNQ